MKQHPPETDSWRRSDTTLWTGIASFRDSRCGATLFNLFTKAEYPDRVTAGVVQQNLEGDEECLSSYCKLMEEKVRACLLLPPFLFVRCDGVINSSFVVGVGLGGCSWVCTTAVCRTASRIGVGARRTRALPQASSWISCGPSVWFERVACARTPICITELAHLAVR